MADLPAPSVLIVGGFATAPPNYWPLRRRLVERGAGRVDIAPTWPPDWVLAGVLGFGSVMRRTGRAIATSYIRGGRRPIIIVAHSGGGIAARLAMSHVPFHGRMAGVADAVGCLVTLGTPHRLWAIPNRYHHAGHDAAEFLERATPGAYFAPRTEYLTIGSDLQRGIVGGPLGRVFDDFFATIVGREAIRAGDGIVPVSAVHLEGAEQITYDDVLHGVIGSPWYGDDEILDRWWPTAQRLWRAALATRSTSAGEPIV